MMIFLRILEMLIGNLFVSLMAIYLFRVLRTDIRHLDTPIFGFSWIYTTTLYAFILGIFGLLESHKIAIISLIGIIILVILKFRKRRVGRKPFQIYIPKIRVPKSILGIILCVLALLQLARILFHIWYIPPYVWDTVVYHLVNVTEWVQKQRIHAVTSPVGRLYWPATFEVLEAWFVVFLHHDIIVQVPSFLCYLVAGAAAYALARVLQIGKLLSAAAALFYLFTPTLAIHATSCNTDLPVAAPYLLSVAILLDLLINGRREKHATSACPYIAKRMLIVIMALSFGFGAKPYTAFISPAPILIFLLAAWKHRLFGDVWNLLRFRHRPSVSRTILCIFLIAGSVLLGFYWLMRNFIIFDNPFHPTDFRVFGHLVFGTGDAPQFGPGQRGSVSLRAMWQNAFTLVTAKIFDNRSTFTSDLGDMSGWGWFNFVCGIPAFFYALIFRKRLRWLIIAFVLSLLGLFACISVDPWYMRFTLWFPVIFALCFVSLIANLKPKWVGVSLMVLAILCAILNYIAVLDVGRFAVADFQKMMALPPLKRSTAEFTHHYDGAYKYTLARIPKDEIIGYCFPNNGWGYPLYDCDLSRRLKYVPIEDGTFINFMQGQNINYLFVERIKAAQQELIQQAVRNGSLEQIQKYLYVLK